MIVRPLTRLLWASSATGGIAAITSWIVALFIDSPTAGGTGSILMVFAILCAVAAYAMFWHFGDTDAWRDRQ